MAVYVRLSVPMSAVMHSEIKNESDAEGIGMGAWCNAVLAAELALRARVRRELHAEAERLVPGKDTL